MDTHIECPYID